jgi:hypothetical protein
MCGWIKNKNELIEIFIVDGWIDGWVNGLMFG